MLHAPRMIAADVPNQGRMYYLIDETLDFVPEVKEFLDWKAATKRAPATIKAYCSRLEWYYRFLEERHLEILEATPSDLTEFVLWLCNPYRNAESVETLPEPESLQATECESHSPGCWSLVLLPRPTRTTRRGLPVVSVDVPKGRWLTERDLLTHTRKGPQRVQRGELKLKEPETIPKTISEQDFKRFVDSIHLDGQPNGDPSGFRDRLLCFLLKEGGFRLGELLGMHVDDLEFGKQGVHVRFRADNENRARAKAGYGRDRFIHLPTAVLGLLDVYLTEVWIEANPVTSHLWIVLKKEARDRDGQSTYGSALSSPAVESMFEHYSKKSGALVHPHLLRHTHATKLVRSYLKDGEPVDWKFVQERLGHASVVTTIETYVHLTDEDRKHAYDRYQEKRKARREQQHASEKL